MNKLPIEHIHIRNNQKNQTLILLLIPSLVFFLTIALFLLKFQPNIDKLSKYSEQSVVLGDHYNIDK